MNKYQLETKLRDIRNGLRLHGNAVQAYEDITDLLASLEPGSEWEEKVEGLGTTHTIKGDK